MFLYRVLWINPPRKGSQRTRLTSASRHSAPDFITNDQKWSNVDPIPEHEFLQNSFLERKDSNNLDPKDKVSESSVQESSWSENVVLDDGDTEYKDYLPSDQREEEGKVISELIIAMTLYFLKFILHIYFPLFIFKIYLH